MEYREGLYVGYRYFETAKVPVTFPFGFGLSYGDVRVESACAEVSEDCVKAKAVLKNSGAATADVLQVYFKFESKDAVRNHALCAFKKVRLGKGESAEISLEIPLSALTVVNDEGVRYLDRAAKTTLYFGMSQPDELSEKLSGKKCVAVEIKL